jgi:hypothetical protein
MADNISNEELWQQTNQKSVLLGIRQRFEMYRPQHHKTSSQTEPPWKEKGVQATKHLPSRDLVKDAKTDHIWAQLKRLAQDREGWRKLIDSLCPVRSDRQKKKTNIDPHGLK